MKRKNITIKGSKFLLTLGLSFSLISAFSLNPVSAASSSGTGTNSDIGIESCPEVGTYTTTYKSHTTTSKTDFEHEASNPSTLADSVTRTVSISHAATVSIGGEASFNALVQGAKISANVGYGYNNTKSLSVTWSIPQGNWLLRAGNKWVKSTGTRYKIVYPCNLGSPQTTVADYSYRTWNDKIEM